MFVYIYIFVCWVIKCCTCATGSISSSLATHACSASLIKYVIVTLCNLYVYIYIYICMLSDKMLHMCNRLQRFHLQPLNNNTTQGCSHLVKHSGSWRTNKGREKKLITEKFKVWAGYAMSLWAQAWDRLYMYVRTYNFMYVYIIIITMWRVIIHVSKELNQTLHMRTMLQIFQK